jgi:glycosyltransferase involved in cell wall biosynthesis
MIVNVVGYFRRQCGLSNNARAIAALLESRGVVVRRITAKHQFFQDNEFASDSPANADVTIWCVNASELIRNREFERSYSRYHVGVFMWELEFNQPPGLHEAANCMDEIWCFSDFLMRAFSSVKTPLIKIPMWISEHLNYLEEFSKDRRFSVMFAFDCASIWRRKNPQAVITAFRRAFSNGASSDVRLIMKTHRIDQDRRFFRDLTRSTADLPVHWITENLSRVEYWKLLRSMDVYISLHRSEGIGLTIAEAIAASVPVIATGYGGNVDFMDDRCTISVPHSMAPNDAHHGPYCAGALWAEPDVNSAAVALQQIRYNLSLRKRLIAGCTEVLSEKLNPTRSADAMLTRLIDLTT